MKIRKISFTNNPLFENLELDFTDEHDNTINTIIIAGENGVGKSFLLNTIFDLSTFTPSNEKSDEVRVFEIEFSKNELEFLRQSRNFGEHFNRYDQNTIFRITINYKDQSTWSQIKIESKTEHGLNQILKNPFPYGEMRNALKTIYSDVEINFTPEPIEKITSSSLDSTSFQSERSNSRIATEITQLLIDVQSLDALDFSDWARNNIGETISIDKIDTRINRFTNAFDFMFPSKKYKRIETKNGRKEIIFEEDGREMTISQLSSGEKQIVFRGGFLLKNKESSRNALILIDEPEISLHPNWQLKILNFFKKLFTNNEGSQTSQIILTTHSPFILHNANRSKDKVIILKKNDNGKVTVLSEPKFFSWSPEKIIQEAYDVSLALSESKTTVFLEGETDEKYFKKCIDLFQKKGLSIDFKWIGRINEKGNPENTGDSALNQAKTFFLANMETIKEKIILLYDNDTNKPNEDYLNLHIRKMSEYPTNTVFKKGIENLLVLIPEIDLQTFYKEKIRIDDYSATSIIRELDKAKLCSFICDTLDVENQKLVFEKINREIELLLTGN